MKLLNNEKSLKILFSKKIMLLVLMAILFAFAVCANDCYLYSQRGGTAYGQGFLSRFDRSAWTDIIPSDVAAAEAAGITYYPQGFEDPAPYPLDVAALIVDSIAADTNNILYAGYMGARQIPETGDDYIGVVSKFDGTDWTPVSVLTYWTSVIDMTFANGKLYAGGYRWLSDNPYISIGVSGYFDGSSWIFLPDVNFVVEEVEIVGTDIFIWGRDGTYWNKMYLNKFDSSTWSWIDLTPVSPYYFYGAYGDIEGYAGNLYAGGFMQPGATGGVYEHQANMWSNPQNMKRVNALASSQAYLYAGGYTPTPVTAIVSRYDGFSWSQLPAIADAKYADSVSYADALYASGRTTSNAFFLTEYDETSNSWISVPAPGDYFINDLVYACDFTEQCKSAKEEQLGILQGMTLANKKDKKYLQKAVDSLQDSLDESKVLKWKDECELYCKGGYGGGHDDDDDEDDDRYEADCYGDKKKRADGKKVFDYERKAVQELMKIKYPSQQILDAIIAITDADRLLAVKAIEANPECNAARAQRAVEKGDYQYSMQRYDRAVSHYRKAWQYATECSCRHNRITGDAVSFDSEDSNILVIVGFVPIIALLLLFLTRKRK